MRIFLCRTLGKAIFLLPLLCLSKLASAQPFQSEFNHYCGSSIDTVWLVGERCSGTTYLLGLMKKNFPSYHVKAPRKHFLPWFDLPAFNISKKLGELKDPGILGDLGESTLFVLVVRDPYDWIRSFYSQPHHASKDKMLGKGLVHFMQHEWIPMEKEKEFEYTAPDHWNPYDQRRFSNVFELRKYKTLNYLQIGMLAGNFLVVKYEDVSKSPERFIDFMSKNFNIQKSDSFQNVTTYKNENKESFHKSDYKPFKAKELGFINRTVDWDVESLIGYDLVPSVKRIQER